MDSQSKALAELIEKIAYRFGTHGLDGECCENISHGEFRALRAAMHAETCTMQDIAKSAVVTKSGATRIITRLEEKGLVRRVHDAKDGRICCVILTSEGKTLLRRIEDDLQTAMKKILSEMEPSMREILLISLKAFSDIAQKHTDDLDY